MRVAALLAGLLAVATSVWAEVAIPPFARVTDLTGTLTAAQQAQLTQRLAAFEQAKGSQIAVLVVPTTQPETIEQYALRVAETWKLGRKGVDDGALLLVAKDDRTLRIEVGYGLEGAIPDAIAKRIIEETITPRFRDGDLHGGIHAGVASVIGLINGEPLPPPPPFARAGVDVDDEQLPFFLGMMAVGAALVAAVAGWILGALFGRFVSSGLVLVIVSGLAWWLSSLWLPSLVVAVIGCLVAWLVTSPADPRLAATAGVRSRYRERSSNDSGSSLSGGSGSSGNSGSSGGGGSFGGGGASGRW